MANTLDLSLAIRPAFRLFGLNEALSNGIADRRFWVLLFQPVRVGRMVEIARPVIFAGKS